MLTMRNIHRHGPKLHHTVGNGAFHLDSVLTEAVIRDVDLLRRFLQEMHHDQAYTRTLGDDCTISQRQGRRRINDNQANWSAILLNSAAKRGYANGSVRLGGPHKSQAGTGFEVVKAARRTGSLH